MGLFKYCVVPLVLAVAAVCQTPSPPRPPVPNIECLTALSISTRPSTEHSLNIQEQQDIYRYIHLSRHHIIPYATMRNFYNALLARDLPAFQRLLTDVVFVAAHNHGITLEMERLIPVNYILPALAQVGEDHLRDVSHAQVSQIQLTREVYAWLPFNIYIGPQPRDRIDDARANALDTTARFLVGEQRIQSLTRVYDAMLRYIGRTHNSGDLDTIISTMADLAYVEQPHDFDPSQWLVMARINEYRFTVVTSDAMRRDTTYREIRVDDYCTPDGEIVTTTTEQSAHRDELKRALGKTKCIVKSPNNDPFCMNALNHIRDAIRIGHLVIKETVDGVTKLGLTNSVVTNFFPSTQTPSLNPNVPVGAGAEGFFVYT